VLLHVFLQSLQRHILLHVHEAHLCADVLENLQLQRSKQVFQSLPGVQVGDVANGDVVEGLLVVLEAHPLEMLPSLVVPLGNLMK